MFGPIGSPDGPIVGSIAAAQRLINEQNNYQAWLAGQQHAGQAPTPPEQPNPTDGPRSSRGRDLSTELTLLPHDAARGGVVRMRVRYPGTCRACRGSGRHSAPPRNRPCPGCAGSGEMDDTATRVRRIRIPAGLTDGKRLRAEGQGEAPPTGRGIPGDLFIRIRIASGTRPDRHGYTLE